jgi:hypothetical protein
VGVNKMNGNGDDCRSTSLTVGNVVTSIIRQKMKRFLNTLC